MRIVVTGMVGTYPVGGVAWDYLQYAMGFERLGHEVWYLEDSGLWAYDPTVNRHVDDGEHAARWIAQVVSELCPSVTDRWLYRAASGRTFGTWQPDQVGTVVAEADLVLNVSGASMLRSEYRLGRVTAMIDTDPGWNHFSVLPNAEAWARASGLPTWRDHDVFLTYAERLGTSGCTLPDLGVRWLATRPPVVLDAWAPARATADAAWTTVMTWTQGADITDEQGQTYGGKERELPKLLPLPNRVDARFELAVGGLEPPVALLRSEGWTTVPSTSISASPTSYREYIEHSAGEVSVAKHVYVATGSGWFSGRSTCYLASGKPVVVQDTGFSAVIPCGDGLFSFTTTDEAATALRTVQADYNRHCLAARAVAVKHFASDLVLGDLLDKVGLG